ncbi:MAG TPA: bifunctional glutamate N-acetyltransferase/amino-acid acetyltransferase ArgJ [Kofleriaceae bacterium]|nr:bifunctional glutamate N-acetyltransferase/amino-acid acetyltransferase ArgJ [Kofleriaceae bacterium]
MRGFRFAGVAAGIKKKGGRDVGLIVADELVPTSAIFTSNRVKAAPVRLSIDRMRMARGMMRGVVVNAGNANACTGAQGDRDASRMAELTAGAIGAWPEHLLVASTGVIGQPLPMPKVEGGIAAACKALSPDGFDDFAAAILTTDRRPKTASLTVRIGGKPVTLVGCTKGAGMIAPNMATTLTFVATDATMVPGALARMTKAAVAPTFNAIAVDGDTSTNDTLAVFASGASKAEISGAGQAKLQGALTELLADLARQLMADGEGVHHVVTIVVRRAANARAAAAIARRVATSPLVKTAIAGGDPNWGRILCAIGNAGVPIDANAIGLAIGDVEVVRKGALVPGYEERKAAAVMKGAAYQLAIDLDAGAAEATFLACDLSHEYVTINADYRS